MLDQNALPIGAFASAACKSPAYAPASDRLNSSKLRSTPRATPPARIETAARALGTPARIAEAALIIVGARRPPVTLVAMERAAETRGATPRAPTTVAESVAGRAPTVNLSRPNCTPPYTPPARID